MSKVRTRPADRRPAAASVAVFDGQSPEDQYRAISNAVNDGILITNPVTGRYIEANRLCCEMFGYEMGELTGQPVETLSSGIPPYTREAAIELYNKAYLGESQTFEWQCKTKNGFAFWTEVSLRFTWRATSAKGLLRRAWKRLSSSSCCRTGTALTSRGSTSLVQ